MGWKILVSAPYFQPVVDRFAQVFKENDIELLVPKVTERMSETELLEIIEDIDGVISGDDHFSAEVLAKGKKLKVISKWGTGIDSIDQEAAGRLGIAVRNTSNAFTMPVADSALAYILCFARQTPWMDRDIRNGTWQKRPGVSLQECTLGVIGIGNIGQAVVRRAVAFGMRVVGSDIAEIPKNFIAETGLEVMGKEALLKEADFVSLNCTLDSDSHHIIDRQALLWMKPTAYLINTARGPLIDEKALATALREGQISGAGMDVFEQEPLPADSPLREMENCLFAPHNSNSSPVAWERVHQSTLDNLLEELNKSL
jgi:D-3-phosphoglycerate dehydrogenase / 2-oxoglutarate reductase